MGESQKLHASSKKTGTRGQGGFIDMKFLEKGKTVGTEVRLTVSEMGVGGGGELGLAPKKGKEMMEVF